ncbi:MAG: phage major tail tube protein [Candidatus Gastranaerophilales bacterium]|nr:phage major tail tube protein [Candidatus Gastranaerophilales bacterium]
MVTALTKATIYLGTNLFGIVSSITCPEINMETSEYKHGLGAYNINVGYQAMTASVTIKGFEKKLLDEIANPFETHVFTVYGSLDTYTNAGYQSSKQAKITMRGNVSKMPLLGELKQQENTELTFEFNISYIQFTVDGDEVKTVDNANLIYRVNGKDILSEIKANLALS